MGFLSAKCVRVGCTKPRKRMPTSGPIDVTSSIVLCNSFFSFVWCRWSKNNFDIFFALANLIFFLHIYTSLCETPDLNSRPLTQKSGALPMSHHIFNGAVAVISNLCSMEFHGLGADKVFSRVNFLLKYKAHLMSFNHFREFT